MKDVDMNQIRSATITYVTKPTDNQLAGIKKFIADQLDVNVDELIKAVSKYKEEIANKDKEISNNSDTNACGCDHSEEYDCDPDECEKCKYSDCACDEYGVHTIEIPDDIWEAINMAADYFLDRDSDEEYEIGITDDGALVIAPSSYNWEDLEDF